MSYLGIKSAKLVSDPDQNSPVLEAVLLPFAQTNGSVFGLIRVNGRPDEKRHHVAQVIVDHLTAFQQSATKDANVPRRFEQILSAINDELGSYVKTVAPLSLTDVHAVIGVVHKNQVFVSGYGSLAAVFMHQTAKRRYVIYELDRQLSDPDATWSKLFTTVLDGEFHPGDNFYVATRINVREISLTELQDILVTLPPAGALKRIQQHASIGTAYGAVAFQIADNTDEGPPKKVNPLTSMEHLGKTKEDTATLLGEQTPDVGGTISKITKPLLDRLSSPGTRGTKSVVQRILKLILKSTIAIVTLSISLLKGLGTIVIRFIKKRQPVKAASETKKAQEKPAVMDHIKNVASRLGRWFTRIPVPAKIVSVGVFVLAFVIVIAVSALNSRTSGQEKEEAFNVIVTRIEEKKDAANASLIYDDKTQARKLLTEAAALLETVVPKSNTEENRVNDLRTQINDAFTSLRGITETNVDQLADLSATAPGSTLTAIVEANGTIYGVAADKSLFRFNELEPKFDREDSTAGSIGVVKTATGSGSNFLFIDANGHLGLANTTSKTLNPVTSGVDALTNVSDITLYNDALYVLAAGTEQIVKMRPQGDGYEAGTAWITSHSTPLAGATSIAIDGDVYVLTPDNVVKFTSGREVAFNEDVIDPPLNGGSELYTTIGTDYVYVLDTTEGRIIVFKKDGTFITQYVSEQIKQAVGMVVREDKRSILFATPTQLFSLTATHLLQ